jgi:hypothetical protein
VQDVQDFDRIGVDAVEDQAVAMNATADAGGTVPVKQGVPFRHFDECCAALPQFADEGHGAERAVQSDVIANRFEIGLRLICERQSLHLRRSA